MNRHHALEIARWEFRRFFKWKDFLITLAVIAGMGLLIKGGLEFAKRQGQTTRTIAVPSLELLPALGEQDRFEFATAEGSLEQLRDAVAGKEYDGFLWMASADTAELFVRGSPGWARDLGTLLTLHRQAARVAESGLQPGELEALFAPYDLTVSEARAGRARPDAVTAFILLGVMVFGVLTGLSYLFVSITGEKTQRITEQILVAVSPQSWIDGKILGLTALTLVHLLSYAAGYIGGARLLWRSEFSVPLAIGDPVVFAGIILLCALAFLFWFAFFGLVASTINDPNSSSRSSLMFVPVLFLAMAFAGVDNPEGAYLVVGSWIPVTAPTFMAMRLVVGQVAAWEMIVAVAGLVFTILLLRRAAGKMFGLAMLMYGKEPGWSEVLYWIRRA